MNGRRTGSAAAILALGLALALSPVAIASASQRSSSSHHTQTHGSSKAKAQSGGSQTAAFCRDYTGAVDIFESNDGAGFSPRDPDLKSIIALLAKAQGVAPSAVKKDVTQMLNESKALYQAKSTTLGNFSKPSGAIAKWGNKHCPSGNSGNSGNTGNSGNSGAAGNSGNSGNSGSSAPSTSRKTGNLTAFCRDVQGVTTDVSTLLATSKDGGTEVSASLLKKSAAAAKHLANEAPSAEKQDAETLARDLKSPNNAHADIVGDEASLSTDYDTDCPGGDAYSGNLGNSGNSGSGNSGSGNSGNSGNFGSSGNSGNSGSLGNSGNS